MSRLLPPEVTTAGRLPSGDDNPPPGGRSWYRRRAVRCVTILLPLTALLACSDTDLTPTTTLGLADAPEADRQSWDVRLQLRGSTSDLIVVAPYLADFLEARQTRADSGALVMVIGRSQSDRWSSGQADPHASTRGDATRDTARIESSTLVVDHQNGSVSFAGDVTIKGGQVLLTTDSVRWERDTDSLTIPHHAQMELESGQVTGRRLAGTTALENWRAEQVWASFLVDGTEGGEDRIGIESRRAMLSVPQNGIRATFDTVSGHWKDRSIQGLKAVYDEPTGKMELLGSISIRDSTGALQADSVHIDLRTDRITASGQVSLTESDRRLEADEITEEETGWQAVGTPVLLDIKTRHLEAPVVTLDRAGQETMTASGGVQVTEGETRQLRADRITLLLDDDTLQAKGVQLRADEFEGILTADRLHSQQGGDQVELLGSPRLIRDGDTDEPLSLEADTLILEMPSRRLEGRGAFNLEVAGSLRIAADRGQLDAESDSMRLEGQTQVRHQENGADHLLEASEVSVELHQSQARSVTWPGSVQGRLRDDQQTTWIAGSAGRLQLTQGRLDTLTLQGSTHVTHQGHDRDRASRFDAKEMILVFDGDGSLRQLEALGQATALSRIVDEDGQVAINEVSGARLRIDLEGGAVVAVRVLDEIEGRYLPPEQNGEPDRSSR